MLLIPIPRRMASRFAAICVMAGLLTAGCNGGAITSAAPPAAAANHSISATAPTDPREAEAARAIPYGVGAPLQPSAIHWGVNCAGEAEEMIPLDQYGRPTQARDLGKALVALLHAEDVDMSQFESLIITDHDISRLSDHYDPGIECTPSAKVSGIIEKSLANLRKEGEAAGILWNEVRWVNAGIESAEKTLNRFAEKADLIIELYSLGNYYRFRVKNVQRAATAVVLTDGFEWIGEEKLE